ncbi:hypothetical protein V8C42DRAFT_332244 [Trichoderma barbatum]
MLLLSPEPPDPTTQQLIVGEVTCFDTSLFVFYFSASLRLVSCPFFVFGQVPIASSVSRARIFKPSSLVSFFTAAASRFIASGGAETRIPQRTPLVYINQDNRMRSETGGCVIVSQEAVSGAGEAGRPVPGTPYRQLAAP